MKTLRVIIIAMVILASAGFISGCKKNNDKKLACRIITTNASTGETYNFTYNEEDKLSTVSIGTRVTNFAYSGNTAIGTTMDNGVFDNKKIITMNAEGLAVNVKTETDQTGTDWNNQVFEYNGVELIKSTHTSSGGGAASTTQYVWSGNNLVSAGTGPSASSLDYYTDKLGQPGDYLFLSQLVEGFEIYRTKNLLKSILAGSNITTFSYTFDADGKVSAIAAVSGGTTSNFNHQYQCE